ncbi:hypothetical protein AX16_006447 [Volvariella volvacea WC 439]|nr:hypothetical protein AX16_006447 [Volvariella volvacea WC 439]
MVTPCPWPPPHRRKGNPSWSTNGNNYKSPLLLFQLPRRPTMPPPPIALFLTTIASQPALRQRQEYLLRTLQVRRIAFTSYDLASDEDAKRLWKRKVPLDKQQLPGILVGGEFPGTFAEFEDAVEGNYLDKFLRLNDEWDPVKHEIRPPPLVKPVGVPGVVMPLQMTPEPLRAQILAQPISFPSRGRLSPESKRSESKEVSLSDELSTFGLDGRVTEDELRQLIAELGLEGDDAGDLVKGLSSPVVTKKEDKGLSSLVIAKTGDQPPKSPAREPKTPTEGPKRDRKKSGRLKPVPINLKSGDAVPLPVPVPALGKGVLKPAKTSPQADPRESNATA